MESENVNRVEVQKKLMLDLLQRGAPFLSRQDKSDYCERFYRSLGHEGVWRKGKVPQQMSSAVRHFFHNNLAIGDVPKWVKEDANLLRKFILVIRIYGPDKAKVKTRESFLKNPRKIGHFPSEVRETFCHLLDEFKVSEEELPLPRQRKQKMEGSDDENRPDHFKQMFNMLAQNLLSPENRQNNLPLELLFQAAGISRLPLPVNPPLQACGVAALQSPALSAALSSPSNVSSSPSTLSSSPSVPSSSPSSKENTPPSNGSKHSFTLENILEKIRRSKGYQEPGEL